MKYEDLRRDVGELFERRPPLRSKESVNYRPLFPGQTKGKCAVCRHFLPPDECERVDGAIEKGYICDLFDPGEKVANG
jgi:hypothetical protein